LSQTLTRRVGCRQPERPVDYPRFFQPEAYGAVPAAWGRVRPGGVVVRVFRHVP